MNKAIHLEQISLVWSACHVEFDLYTTDSYIYAVYFNHEKQMTIAQRHQAESTWKRYAIPSAQNSPPPYDTPTTSTLLGWDSHNFVVVAVDREGYIHVSGNMHCNALTYFRSQKPHAIETLEQIPTMIGQNEKQCTYPRFLKNNQGDLIFHYRDGISGSGNEIFNRYDENTQQWERMLETNFTDGQGERNAYMIGPLKGPDDYFHLCWGWRETGDASTSHDMSYARSRDLLQWESIHGTPIQLPITSERTELIVDPIPQGGGLLNTGKIGFDTKKQVVLSYMKYDKHGNNQIYNARWEGDQWKVYQLTNWEHRWEIKGCGTLDCEVFCYPVEIRNGMLIQKTEHRNNGIHFWVLDEPTMAIKEEHMDWQYNYLSPRFLDKRVQVHWRSDSGNPRNDGQTYLLRWETRPQNYDSPLPTQLIPPPSPLELIQLTDVSNRS
jgi:hypothetical protein